MEPTIERPAPLTYDEAIYWRDESHHVEQMMSRALLKDERERAWAYRVARSELDHMCRDKIRELGWGAYHIEEEERKDNLYVYLRRALYECPRYAKIELWRGPEDNPTLNANMVTLPLRRLMYYKERARGALHDDILYVVLP